jgi:hypothetical protein
MTSMIRLLCGLPSLAEGCMCQFPADVAVRPAIVAITQVVVVCVLKK